MTDLALLQNVLRNEIMRSVPHLNAQATQCLDQNQLLMCVGFLQPFWLSKQTSIVLNCYSVTLCMMSVYITLLQTLGGMYNVGYSIWCVCMCVLQSIRLSVTMFFAATCMTPGQKTTPPTVKCLQYLYFKFTIFVKKITCQSYGAKTSKMQISTGCPKPRSILGSIIMESCNADSYIHNPVEDQVSVFF